MPPKKETDSIPGVMRMGEGGPIRKGGGGVGGAPRRVYDAAFKLHVVKHALSLPPNNRHKPIARCYPGLTPVQVRKWIRNAAALELAVPSAKLVLNQPPSTIADYKKPPVYTRSPRSVCPVTPTTEGAAQMWDAMNRCGEAGRTAMVQSQPHMQPPRSSMPPGLGVIDGPFSRQRPPNLVNASFAGQPMRGPCMWQPPAPNMIMMPRMPHVGMGNGSMPPSMPIDAMALGPVGMGMGMAPPSFGGPAHFMRMGTNLPMPPTGMMAPIQHAPFAPPPMVHPPPPPMCSAPPSGQPGVQGQVLFLAIERVR
jgi:transposase-like protein